MTLSILTVPAFDDNYLWIVHNGQSAIVIDPGDGDVILQALAQHQLQLSAVLVTHHHRDHVGGVAQLAAHFKVPVYGPAKENIPALSHGLVGGERLHIEALNWSPRVIAVPGHTLGHIAYYCAQAHWLFCGDTLFAGGCGRLFEGSPAQMLCSLDQLAALPDSTRIYCAHEYTLANLAFAMAVEPENPAIPERLHQEQEKRRRGLPTVPSTMGLERCSNPFLRTREPQVRRHLEQRGLVSNSADDATYFAALRLWKNQFRSYES